MDYLKYVTTLVEYFIVSKSGLRPILLVKMYSGIYSTLENSLATIWATSYIPWFLAQRIENLHSHES